MLLTFVLPSVDVVQAVVASANAAASKTANADPPIVPYAFLNSASAAVAASLTLPASFLLTTS